MKTRQKTLLTLLAVAISGIMQSAHAETVLRRGNGSEPKTIDPQIAEGMPEANIMLDLFEGLTTRDGAANIIPGVADGTSRQTAKPTPSTCATPPGRTAPR